jgi:hypothetical protein
MYLLEVRYIVIEDENSNIDKKHFRHSSKDYCTGREISGKFS